MPAHVKKRGNKYRVVEPSGKLMRNQAGTPVDGGGYSSSTRARKQVQAINIRMRKRKKG